MIQRAQPAHLPHQRIASTLPPFSARPATAGSGLFWLWLRFPASCRSTSAFTVS